MSSPQIPKAQGSGNQKVIVLLQLKGVFQLTMTKYYRINSHHHGKVISYGDLKSYTHEFSEANYIGRFQYGKVYRGTIPADSDGTEEAREVTVKIWEDTDYYILFPGDNEERLEEEVILLNQPTMASHPNLVKLIGYCSDGEHLGVVYDLKPLNTVHNLILQDEERFSWVRRIKVSLEFACLLEFFHSPREPYCPYLIRNVDANHIMLDQDYNSKLFDFSTIAGGIFPERRKITKRGPPGCHGYLCHEYGCLGSRWAESYDVFSFGVLLLCLISKRVIDLEKAAQNDGIIPVYKWAKTEYYKSKKSLIGLRQPNRSLVHPSFNAESEFYSSDGPIITKLAMQCVKDSSQRPTMKQVVDRLLNLHVVRVHAGRLGIGGLVRGCDRTSQKAPKCAETKFQKLNYICCRSLYGLNQAIW